MPFGESASDTCQTNYNMTILGDMIDIEASSIPEYDIQCAGFSCRPFSQCGNQEDFEDTHGTLFYAP